MATPADHQESLRRNRLLALLDEPCLDAIRDELDFVPLEVPHKLMLEGKPIRYAWFPVDGVMSMLASADEARTKIEVGTVGNEGMVGLPLLLGDGVAPGECFAQVAGHAWRMPAAAFAQAVQAHPALERVLHRYTQALLVQISQSAACNRVHTPLQRCARWLLMTSDRVHGDSFVLTQEFLAQMLGERRPTVSRVASALQARRMITYSRGRISITDRARLAETACPCYGIVRGTFERLLARSASD